MYDENRYSQRMRFTILHELGHVCLGHTRHGKQEELEANFFAAQMLIPDAIINQFIKKGYHINAGCLMSAFYVSNECACNKIESIRNNLQKNKLDKDICRSFNHFLFCIPKNVDINIEVS